jgi:hypothetical protein
LDELASADEVILIGELGAKQANISHTADLWSHLVSSQHYHVLDAYNHPDVTYFGTKIGSENGNRKRKPGFDKGLC